MRFCFRKKPPEERSKLVAEGGETNGGGSVGRVIFGMSMSLDGFVTGPNVRPEAPNGDGGLRLVEWAFGDDERDREYNAALPAEQGEPGSGGGAV